jgi:hypothetical protein
MTSAKYDEIAEWYDKSVRRGLPPLDLAPAGGFYTR